MNISPNEPSWLDLEDIINIQREQIELYGGSHGVRDDGLVDSALGRARNLYDIGGEEDVLVIAVALGIGIAKNHGFIDGNKRAGAFAMIEFLAINGYWLDLPNDDFLGKAFERTVIGGDLEADLVALLGEHLVEMAND